MLTLRATWYNNGLADSAQLNGEVLLAQASPHTSTQQDEDESPHTGVSRLSAWPGRAAHCLSAQGGGRLRIPPALRAILPWLRWGRPDFLTPTPEPGKPPFLYFLYYFPYSPLMWTCLAGTLSTSNSFLSATDYDPCQQALPPFSHICPGKVVTVQYLVLDGDAWEHGVVRQVVTRRGKELRKN